MIDEPDSDRLEKLFARIERDEYARHEQLFVDVLRRLAGRAASVSHDEDQPTDVRTEMLDAQTTFERLQGVTLNLLGEHVQDIGVQGRLLSQIAEGLRLAFTTGQSERLASTSPAKGKDTATARKRKVVKVAERIDVVRPLAVSWWQNNRHLKGNCFQAVTAEDGIFDAANAALKAAGCRPYGSRTGMRGLLQKWWDGEATKLT